MAIVITPSQFRIDFPEFADITVFTDAQITFWASIAVALVNECRWGDDLATAGAELVVAFNLSLGAANQQTVMNGGIPGVGGGGPVTGMSVDKVSIEFDASAAAGSLERAGMWALNEYGVRYLTLLRLSGAGVMQVGGYDCGSPGGYFFNC